MYYLKEVYFGEYCQKCKYSKTAEADEPCADCLEAPVNEFSHKPVKYEEK